MNAENQIVPLKERTCAITVRLPESEHRAIRIAAHVARVSMNQFCRDVLWPVAESMAKDYDDGSNSNS